MKIVTDLIVKSAHKEYDCDACKMIIDAFGSLDKFMTKFYFEMTLNEFKALGLANNHVCKILIGDSYRKLFYVDDNGKLVTFRGLTDIQKICQQFEITHEVATVLS